MDWSKYQGKFVSVLITGKEGKEENYLGHIVSTDDGFIVINTKGINNVIDEIAFKLTMINSIWIYKDKQTKKDKLALRDKCGLGYPK